MTYKLNAVRRVTRTVFQAIIGLASMAPLIYSAATERDPALAGGWAGAAIAITAGVSRVMALPAVELFLQTYVPWLAAHDPEPDDELLVPDDEPPPKPVH